MASVNKVILVGHLGKDPEIRHFPSGSKYATFSLATSESWQDKKTGERQQKTEWHNINVTNERLVEFCEKYLKKGSQVYLEGQLHTRKWTDNSGVERYATDVVLPRFKGNLTLLDGRKDSDSTETTSAYPNDGQPNRSTVTFNNNNEPSKGPPSPYLLDDDIPF